MSEINGINSLVRFSCGMVALCIVVSTAFAEDSSAANRALAKAVSEAKKLETTATVGFELRTSGSVAAIKHKGDFKPVFPKVAHTFFPAIKTPPRIWRPAPGDPMGERGWFAVAWTVTDRLPKTDKEWKAWSDNVARRHIARLQAIVDRRGQLAELSFENTAQIARMLYLTRLASSDKSLFDDPLIPVLREAALREQLKSRINDLEPALARYDEARFELARQSDMESGNARVKLDEALLPCVSQWEIVRLFNALVAKQRMVNVDELLQAEKEIALLENALNPQYGVGMLTPGETEIPPPYVPYTTTLPIDDGQLPSATVKLPSMKVPDPHWLEVIASDEKDKVVAQEGGEVVYANRLEGAGVVIILAHPDNLFSVYSNLSQTVVNTGQIVAKGDELGIVGVVSNGKIGLRFAARRKDVPTSVSVFMETVDPKNLLKKAKP